MLILYGPRDGSGGQARGKRPLRVGEFLPQDPALRYGAMFVRSNQGSDQLKTQNEEKEEDPQDFARPPLRQPALQPRKQHASQDNVHQSKSEEHDGGPGERARLRDADADVDSEQPQAGHGRRRIQRSVSQADQKVRPVAQRETQKI